MNKQFFKRYQKMLYVSAFTFLFSSASHSQDCLADGMVLFNKLNFKQAIIKVQNCTGQKGISKLLGDSYFALGYMEEAQSYLKMASDENPEDLSIKVKYLKSIASNKEFKRALAEFRSLASSYPQDTIVKKGFAEILGWNRLYDEAIQQYREITMVNKYDFYSRLQIAILTSWNKKFPESIVEFDKIIADNPPHSIMLDALLNRAQVIGWQKKLDESINAYKEIIKFDPKCIDAYLGIAMVLEWQNKFNDAKKQYEKALQISPENKTVKLKLASLTWAK